MARRSAPGGPRPGRLPEAQDLLVIGAISAATVTGRNAA
jgi:hypothetical protein